MYPHLLHKVFYEPWMITEAAHHTIRQALLSRLAGQPVAEPLAAGLFDTGGPADDEPYQVHGRTAIIPMHGIMGKHMSSLEMLCGGCSIDATSEHLDRAATDPRIDHILLAINSPGGTVQGTPELADQVRDIAATSGKTILAYTDALMCSAAYYVASQAHQVYAAGSATLGSIGVIVRHQDISRALETEGIKITEVTGGAKKAQFSPYRPLSPDDLADLQEECDLMHATFKVAVHQGRGAVEAVYMQGQTFDGHSAVDINLADAIYPTLGALLKALPQ